MGRLIVHGAQCVLGCSPSPLPYLSVCLSPLVRISSRNKGRTEPGRQVYGGEGRLMSGMGRKGGRKRGTGRGGGPVLLWTLAGGELARVG